jgi:hypothetical protein
MSAKNPNLATQLALGLAVLAAIASSLRITDASVESIRTLQTAPYITFPEAASFAAAAGHPPEAVSGL